MIRTLLSVFCLVGAGCADVPVDKKVIIGPDFKDLVSYFVLEASQHGRLIRIDNLIVAYSVELEGTDEIGTCRHGLNTTPIISVNKLWWDSSTVVGHEQLIFHELGHCLLGRDHVTGTAPFGGPLSVMTPYSFPDIIYTDNHEYYMIELFR